jgi:hypothetical protein
VAIGCRGIGGKGGLVGWLIGWLVACVCGCGWGAANERGSFSSCDRDLIDRSDTGASVDGRPQWQQQQQEGAFIKPSTRVGKETDTRTTTYSSKGGGGEREVVREATRKRRKLEGAKRTKAWGELPAFFGGPTLGGVRYDDRWSVSRSHRPRAATPAGEKHPRACASLLAFPDLMRFIHFCPQLWGQRRRGGRFLCVVGLVGEGVCPACLFLIPPPAAQQQQQQAPAPSQATHEKQQQARSSSSSSSSSSTHIIRTGRGGPRACNVADTSHGFSLLVSKTSSARFWAPISSVCFQLLFCGRAAGGPGRPKQQQQQQWACRRCSRLAAGFVLSWCQINAPH